jgi:hypothetical protein
MMADFIQIERVMLNLTLMFLFCSSAEDERQSCVLSLRRRPHPLSWLRAAGHYRLARLAAKVGPEIPRELAAIIRVFKPGASETQRCGGA